MRRGEPQIEIFRERLTVLAGMSYGLGPEEAAGPVSVALERWGESGGNSRGELSALVDHLHRACGEFLKDRGGACPAGPPDPPPARGSAAPLAGVLERRGSGALLAALARLEPGKKALLRRLLESRRAPSRDR